MLTTARWGQRAANNSGLNQMAVPWYSSPYLVEDPVSEMPVEFPAICLAGIQWDHGSRYVPDYESSGLGRLAGSEDNLMRWYAPRLRSSGCGSMAKIVMSPRSGPYAQKTRPAAGVSFSR